MIKLTQGDALSILLTAKIGGVAYDLTGASFDSFIRMPDGSEMDIINSAHTPLAQTGVTLGQFRIALTSSQTKSLPPISGINITTRVTQGASIIHFRGRQIITVYTRT